MAGSSSIDRWPVRGAGPVLVAGGAPHLTDRAIGRLDGRGVALDEGTGAPNWRRMDLAELRQALVRIRLRHGQFDGLVCVAADGDAPDGSGDDPAAWRTLFQNVVVATDRLVRAATDHLRPEAALVFVLTSGTEDGSAEAPAVAAAMAACRNLMQSWALTLAPVGINVNAVCMPPAAELSDAAQTSRRDSGAELLRFLLSDAARDVTGQTLSV